ncbi:MAG TPA: glycoside hydrolase family 88 protein [Terracidiphilus sp.]|jgi:unsaturated rhamnogalacturonyl hydrolase
MSITRVLPTRLSPFDDRAGEALVSHFKAVGPLLVCWFIALACPAQTKPVAERAADELIAREPASRWTLTTGSELDGLEAAWYNTADGNYFRYVKRTVDDYLAKQPVESLQGRAEEEATLGSQVLLLNRITLSPHYYQAANTLRQQLAASCGLSSTHNLADRADSSNTICAAAPFLAAYASIFHQPQDFAAILKSLLRWHDRVEQRTETRGPSASPEDDDLSEARLAVALVDTIGYFPAQDAGRIQLNLLLNKIAASLARRQDGKTGAFNETSRIPGKARTPTSFRNTCLYVFALLKGVRLGWIDQTYSSVADRAWQDIVNDAEAAHSGSGEFLLAATEAELAPTATLGRGNTVMIDAWFNSQLRKNAAGQTELFHYKWSDLSDSGYSLLGHLFRSFGAATDTLPSAPTRENLAHAQFYLIASPDIPVKNPDPHYMTEPDAAEVAGWVHDGGILILMQNDPPNADISHFNLLADKFGIHFDDVLHHHILGEHVEDGRIPVAAGGPLFHQAHTLYMKDTCAISVHGTGKALLTDRGDIVMATVKYGRGTVFAAVDPWAYNEYTDGRKNPQIYNQFDNFAGARELVRWLMEQHTGSKSENQKEAGSQ